MSHYHKIRTLVLILLLLTSSSLFTLDSTLEKLDLDVKFSVEVDNSLKYPEDIQSLDFISAQLEFEFEIWKNFEAGLEMDANRFEVEVDEIYLDWESHDYGSVTLGIIENELTLEEYRPAHKRLFGNEGLITDYIDALGYAGSGHIGVKLYKEYKKKTLPISYMLHLFYSDSQAEAEVNAGFFYHFNKEDSYLGLLVGYIPYLIRPSVIDTLEEERVHNVMVDFVWADHESDLIHGLELTFGSNLIDPIGLVQTSGEGDRSYFLGGDMYLGYTVPFEKIKWTPAIRLSVLFPEITVPEARQMEVHLGNRLQWKKTVYLHLDGGLGIDTRVFKGNVQTRLEALYAITLDVRL